MNINELKTRYTKITGLSSTASAVYRDSGYHRAVARGLCHVVDNCQTPKIDCRHKEFWVLLNEYLDMYAEIGENA